MKNIFYKALALVTIAAISIFIQLHPAGFYFGVGHGGRGGHSWHRYRQPYHRRYRRGFGFDVLFSGHSRGSWHHKIVKAVQNNDKELADHGQRITNIEADLKAHREVLEKLMQQAAK
jgi:hypothetical protein